MRIWGWTLGKNLCFIIIVISNTASSSFASFVLLLNKGGQAKGKLNLNRPPFQHHGFVTVIYEIIAMI